MDKKASLEQENSIIRRMQRATFHMEFLHKFNFYNFFFNIFLEISHLSSHRSQGFWRTCRISMKLLSLYKLILLCMGVWHGREGGREGDKFMTNKCPLAHIAGYSLDIQLCNFGNGGGERKHSIHSVVLNTSGDKACVMLHPTGADFSVSGVVSSMAQTWKRWRHHIGKQTYEEDKH